MISFSANLGFLWQDRALLDAVHVAKSAGFAAVECHWPYDTPAEQLRKAVSDAALPLISLNTRPGAKGEFGLTALPGREAEARAAIDEAIAYGHAVGAQAVHVMAGIGGDLECFAKNLRYACAKAAPLGITILIEPINAQDVPGYTLTTSGQAMALIAEINAPNLKLMFDCYHIAKSEGEVAARFAACRDHIGHIQIAGVPDRGEPDLGTLNYAALLRTIAATGWTAPIGAEYRPTGTTEASLGWLNTLPQADMI